MTRPAQIVAVGEILWDIFPDRQVRLRNSRKTDSLRLEESASFSEYWSRAGAAFALGGATYNFCVHASTLGHKVHLLSAVGDDELGARALDQAAGHGLQVQVIEGANTGRVTVTVDAEGQPSYKLHRPAAYDEAIWIAPAVEPDWIYFGTLHQVYEKPRNLTKRLCETYPQARCFYDINLRVDSYWKELLWELLPLADVLKLNDGEMEELRRFGICKGLDPEKCCTELAETFELEMVCVTRGEHGCAIWQDGNFVETAGIPTKVVDTVGAGDAFSAAVVHGIQAGWPIERVAEFANRVGAYVASRRGGTPALNFEEIERV